MHGQQNIKKEIRGCISTALEPTDQNDSVNVDSPDVYCGIVWGWLYTLNTYGYSARNSTACSCQL